MTHPTFAVIGSVNKESDSEKTPENFDEENRKWVCRARRNEEDFGPNHPILDFYRESI